MMHSIGKDLKIEVTEDEMTPEKYLKEKIDSSDREVGSLFGCVQL